MIGAGVATALGDAVVLVVADAGHTTEMVIAELRATQTDERDSVLLLIARHVAALERAMLRGAMGQLAVELAPAKRLNAVEIIGDAADADVIAAAKFLATARSTTGQTIEIR